MATEKEIQDWYDSGPIKKDTLEMWLSIIQESEKSNTKKGSNDESDGI